MASKMNVEPYAMFQRVDRDKDGLVSPLDLLQFLRECNFHGYHEADCYYLVKFFDSDSDLAMSYADFLQMVLPCNNELLRAIASQRPNETYVKVPGDIPEEVEKELALLIMMEIDMHRQSEPLKQELRCVKEYSDDSLIICDGTLKFDGLDVDSFDKVSIIKADTLIPSVMAASILAKTYRDDKMKKLHQVYPYYDWNNNMGYYGANGLHIAGIKTHGYSPLHRLSYKLKALEGLQIPTFEMPVT